MSGRSGNTGSVRTQPTSVSLKSQSARYEKTKKLVESWSKSGQTFNLWYLQVMYGQTAMVMLCGHGNVTEQHIVVPELGDEKIVVHEGGRLEWV